MSMKESVIKVDGLLTAGCAHNVENALMKIPGVHHASANYLNNTTTVHYDENQVSLNTLQAAVADCGYACAGESAPEHMQHTAHDVTRWASRRHATHRPKQGITPCTPDTRCPPPLTLPMRAMQWRGR